MSDFVNAAAAALWLDGDAFRAPAGVALPTDPFASQPQVLVATVATNMDAFGGIEAGFTVTPAQDQTDHTVWNDKSGAAYLTDKKPPTTDIKFRPTDYSKATALTILTGGSIVTVSAGLFEWQPGDDEEFALLIRVLSGSKQQAIWMERATLASPPPQTWDDSDIAGWDIDIKPLAPASGLKAVRTFTNFNPLA